MIIDKYIRNSVVSGLIWGVGLPVLTYGVLFGLYTLLDKVGFLSDIGFAPDFRIRTLGLIAICTNLLLIQFYRKAYKHEFVRGILMSTMLLVVIWFLFFGVNIMKG